MLTDLALKRLKPKEKLYKLSDRDGMYVVVAPSGLITFGYDYRLNDRRETLTIGRYGPDGIGLSEARDRCTAARKRSVYVVSSRDRPRQFRDLRAQEIFGSENSLSAKSGAGLAAAPSSRSRSRATLESESSMPTVIL